MGLVNERAIINVRVVMEAGFKALSDEMKGNTPMKGGRGLQ